MDAATLAQLRTRLDGERADLRRQLDDLGARQDAEGIEDPELDEGFADAGQAAAERSNLLGLVESLREMLRAVDEALARVDAGTYGKCVQCGEPIGEERIEALPVARLCMRCKHNA